MHGMRGVVEGEPVDRSGREGTERGNAVIQKPVPVEWRWRQEPGLGTVTARTKSQARGEFKRRLKLPRRDVLGYKRILPPGAIIEEV